MKCLSILSLILCVLMISGCSREVCCNLNKVYKIDPNEEILAVSEVIEQLIFESVDDLIIFNERVKNNEISIEEKELINNTNYLNLKSIKIPSNIPENYPLYKISITSFGVSIWFVHESEIHRGIATDNLFHFFSYRWDVDDPMEGIMIQDNASPNDLIMGKYLFSEPNLFSWGEDRNLYGLYIPSHYTRGRGNAMIQFFETYTLPLQ